LLSLRAEAKKATLDSAIAARANAYYSKYGSQAQIITRLKAAYSPAVAGTNSKLARLEELASIAKAQEGMLLTAYNATGKTGVVMTTTSDLTSSTETTDFVYSYSREAESGSDNSTMNDNLTTTTTTGDTTFSQDRSVATQSQGKDVAKETGTQVTNGTQSQSGYQSEVANSSGTAHQTQQMTNTDYGYRVPSLECQAMNLRAQVSLTDEQVAEFVFDQQLNSLDNIFANELAMIDLSVKSLQLAYLDTLLLSPIDGIVTAVMRNPGDSVTAGQGVIRVENNSPVYLVGTVIHRGMISANVSTATIETTSAFGDPASVLSLSGTVVAAQGRESNDDRWDIVVSCDNLDGNGNPIFPLYYGFDYDDTTILVVP
jgi:multidrug efflux pump subunit AcrA (membrane-fusion protein)